jgi:hypothetical protein
MNLKECNELGFVPERKRLRALKTKFDLHERQADCDTWYPIQFQDQWGLLAVKWSLLCDQILGQGEFEQLNVKLHLSH